MTAHASAPGGATLRFASFVAETRTDDIPSDAILGARDALIDTIGCGIAGVADEPSRIAQSLLEDTGGRPQAGVWGATLKAPAADAAFANAIAAHALDFDDSSLNLRGHPSALMISAAFAVGEAQQSTGREVLAAYACGLEVGARLSPALGPDHYFRGWHTTATIGVFAAAAIAARLMKLDTAHTCHALGLAASQAAGLTRNFGSMTKAYHVGHASRCGVVSALLAKKGFTADPGILEGHNGFVEAYRGERNRPLDEVAETLGKPWELVTPGLYRKRYPCCFAVHRAVAGLLDMLVEHDIRTDDITCIDVGYLPGVQHPMIHHDPKNGLEGKFSTEYCIAAAALDRRLDIESFADATVMRPAVRSLMRKVTTHEIPDPNVYNGLTGYNTLDITTTRGRYSKRIDRTPGSPDWPLTGPALEEKFLSCARQLLDEQTANRALQLSLAVPEASDLSALAAALRHG